MTKRVFPMMLVAVLAVFCIVTAVQADEGMPRAVFENDTHEFGAVYEGVDVIHDFVIQNKGDADLEITDVKAG
jgi:hypothetical protein